MAGLLAGVKLPSASIGPGSSGSSDSDSEPVFSSKPEPEPENPPESREVVRNELTKQGPTDISLAAQQLAQSMSDAATAEATRQQASEDKSHLPAWLRSSGVTIAAHRLHVKSTVQNVQKLQVEVERLKASHMLFSKTDWPGGTLWNPDGERKERPPPPCPMDLLPDEVLIWMC